MTTNILLWLLFIALEIARNYLLIETLKLRPHYGYSAMIRFAFGAICLFYAHPEFDPVGAFVYRDLNAILPGVIHGLFEWTSFYVSFDLILNLLRGLAWDYRGKNSGGLDKLPDAKYYCLKAASLAVLILTLFVMYAR